MPKSEENKKYAVVAEFVLNNLHTIFSDNDESDFVFSPDNEDLKKLACGLLEIAKGHQEPVQECMIQLLFLLRDIRDVSRYDCSTKDKLRDKQKEYASRGERYQKAKKCLDEAAALLELPSGYYYSHIEETRPRLTSSNGDADMKCRNYAEENEFQYVGTSGVPRFVGESFEFYIKRLPPEAHGIAWYEIKEQELLKVYGVSGGGETNEASERRFQVAASIVVATFIPEDVRNPYKLISDLLGLCGIERSGKDVRSAIYDRDRRSENKILGSNRCLKRLTEAVGRNE